MKYLIRTSIDVEIDTDYPKYRGPKAAEDILAATRAEFEELMLPEQVDDGQRVTNVFVELVA